MEYSPRDPVLQTQDAETTPSERVVDAVAEAEDVDPIELEPLYAAIDPDALDAVVRSQQEGRIAPRTSTLVRFEYQGYRVTVAGDGAVDVDAA